MNLHFMWTNRTVNIYSSIHNISLNWSDRIINFVASLYNSVSCFALMKNTVHVRLATADSANFFLLQNIEKRTNVINACFSTFIFFFNKKKTCVSNLFRTLHFFTAKHHCHTMRAERAFQPEIEFNNDQIFKMELEYVFQ